jgi:hypothetical protein
MHMLYTVPDLADAVERIFVKRVYAFPDIYSIFDIAHSQCYAT